MSGNVHDGESRARVLSLLSFAQELTRSAEDPHRSLAKVPPLAQTAASGGSTTDRVSTVRRRTPEASEEPEDGRVNDSQDVA